MEIKKSNELTLFELESKKHLIYKIVKDTLSKDFPEALIQIIVDYYAQSIKEQPIQLKQILQKQLGEDFPQEAIDLILEYNDETFPITYIDSQPSAFSVILTPAILRLSQNSEILELANNTFVEPSREHSFISFLNDLVRGYRINNKLLPVTLSTSEMEVKTMIDKEFGMPGAYELIRSCHSQSLSFYGSIIPKAALTRPGISIQFETHCPGRSDNYNYCVHNGSIHLQTFIQITDVTYSGISTDGNYLRIPCISLEDQQRFQANLVIYSKLLRDRGEEVQFIRLDTLTKSAMNFFLALYMQSSINLERIIDPTIFALELDAGTNAKIHRTPQTDFMFSVRTMREQNAARERTHTEEAKKIEATILKLQQELAALQEKRDALTEIIDTDKNALKLIDKKQEDITNGIKAQIAAERKTRGHRKTSSSFFSSHSETPHVDRSTVIKIRSTPVNTASNREVKELVTVRQAQVSTESKLHLLSSPASSSNYADSKTLAGSLTTAKRPGHAKSQSTLIMPATPGVTPNLLELFSAQIPFTVSEESEDDCKKELEDQNEEGQLETVQVAVT